MILNLRLDAYGSIDFTSGLPPDFSHYLLPKAIAHHAIGPWGMICFQEVKTNHFSLRHFLLHLQKALSFTVREEWKGLQSLVNLKGEIDYKIDGLKTIRVREKEFLLFNANEQETITTVNAGKLCSILLSNYSPLVYESWLSLFPGLKKSLRKAARKPRIFSPYPKVAKYTVHDAITAIWFDKYVTALQEKHIEIRIESCLFTQLAQTYAQDNSNHPTTREREMASAAREIILRDISRHLTPASIALELTCSDGWLKRAFSKVYGIGMFHFLRKTRMERAREMLLNGDPLKIVALEVGMRPNNFPKEFKSFFGYTVTVLKKGKN